MRFFHDRVNTGCTYCHGGGCVHCAARHLTRITGEIVMGISSVEQLERVIDCLNLRQELQLNLTIAVPGPEMADRVFKRFCGDAPPAVMGTKDGGMVCVPGEVPVPRSSDSRERVRALLAQMEATNPDAPELQHARKMLAQWSQHSSRYALQQTDHWRAEVARLEAAAEAAGAGEVVEGPPRPQRIVLQRRKGWKMPENTVKVDRATKWGNPFKVGKLVTGIPGLCASGSEERELKAPDEAVHCYRCWLGGVVTIYGMVKPPDRWKIQRDLRGKNLACWCKKGAPCHADVLLEIANGEEAGE